MRLLLSMLLGFSLLVVAASGTRAQSAPAAGRDQVVIGMAFEPSTLNAMFTTRGEAVVVRATLFTRDVQWDDNWNQLPQGVEYIPSLKDGTWTVDGELITLLWKIRRRNWHDGRPVTCGDYVFAHNVARDERVGVAVRIDTDRIAGVSCPRGAGGREIAVRWKARYADASSRVTEYGALPRHLLESSYRLNPSRFGQTFGIDPRITIGDGPYRLVDWRKTESLTVEAVSGHAIFGTARIRRIIWRFLDPETLSHSLLSGAIDLISVIGLDFDQAIELARRAEGRVRVVFSSGFIWEHIDFNLDNPLLQDIRVRRAIAHGINRVQLVQQLFGGRQPVSHTYLPPRHPAYTDAVQKYPYDPTRARALLLQAGFSPGPDGIMRDAAGQRLSLELTTTAEIRIRVRVEQLIQQQLRQVGIDITIVNFPRRLFFSETLPRRKYTALALYAWVWGPTSTCDLIYTSDGITSEADPGKGGNYPGYRNAEMHQACKAAARELNEEQRIVLLRKTAQIFSRELPAMPLFYRTDVAAVKPGLQNFTLPGLFTTPETWNAHTWYWK